MATIDKRKPLKKKKKPQTDTKLKNDTIDKEICPLRENEAATSSASSPSECKRSAINLSLEVPSISGISPVIYTEVVEKLTEESEEQNVNTKIYTEVNTISYPSLQREEHSAPIITKSTTSIEKLSSIEVVGTLTEESEEQNVKTKIYTEVNTISYPSLNMEEPSAPIITESPTSVQKFCNNQPITKNSLYKYLDRSSILNDERKSEDVHVELKHIEHVGSQQITFTSEQLKEVYYCRDIELVDQFERAFLENSLHNTYQNDTLTILLTKYSLLRSNLRNNLIDLENHKADFLKLRNKIWEQNEQTVKFSGICGDNMTVYFTEKYKLAVLNKRHLKLAAVMLSEIYNLISFTYTSNLIYAEVTKQKIEQIIRKLLTHPCSTAVNESPSISLHTYLGPETSVFVESLRNAVAILFYFFRKPYPDKEFSDDIKKWLTELIALHLRVATKEDHWFLLFQILRCPTGISTWATCFLQIPIPLNWNECDFFSSSELSHCISVLHVILSPVKHRNEFLKSFSQFHQESYDPKKEDLWVLVESDGEEGSTPAGECIGLRENDLIGLLNQVPLEQIFSAALNVMETPEGKIMCSDFVTGKHVLTFVAFCSTLIDLLGRGLITYNTERYKQFAKRLGRLTKQVLQYMSEYHQLFIENKLSKDPILCERISVLLNATLIKACRYIYQIRNLGTWQYFLTLPFESLDEGTLWELFYCLNVGFPENHLTRSFDYQQRYHSSDFWLKFNDANTDSSPEDFYFLLQTFFEMASARHKFEDRHLRKSICLYIFNVGFINHATKEICYKTSRDLLVNIILKYPDLMSALIMLVRDRIKEIENIVYLFNSLSLQNWRPSVESFEILSDWILNYTYDSNENIVARIIFGHLNWNFDENGQLFLPYSIHVRMACLISDSLTKHAPELVKSQGIFHLSSLIDAQPTTERFAAWCWDMVSILRLHSMDQSPILMKGMLQNPAEHLKFIPDLESIKPIYHGVTENRPLAAYISILVSAWGHSVPLICQKGFDQMKFLLKSCRHFAAIRCIQLTTPLFLECPEILANCESFQNILEILITADKTYLKRAKDLIYSDLVGPVFELFNSMIHCQVINYTDLCLLSPAPLIHLWILALTNVKNWQSSCIVFLIDNLIKVAYQFPDAWYSSKEYFRSLYKDCQDWKKQKTSSLKVLFGANSKSEIPSLTSSNSWLSLLLLEVEFESKDAHIWPEFLRQIASCRNRNLDVILKELLEALHCEVFSPNCLVMYKYANIISTMDIHHPLFIIMNQKFFTLYLARVPMHYNDDSFQRTHGVSDIFYDYNILLMEKVKSQLKAAEKYFLSEVNNNDNNEENNLFYKTCSSLMHTYLLWLEENKFNNISKDDHISLPTQYKPDKLKEIFQGIDKHWTEFVDLKAIRTTQKHSGEEWSKRSFRSICNVATKSLPQKQITSSMERIISLLKSYEKPIDPPKLVKEKTIYSECTDNIIGDMTMKLLRKDLELLDAESRKFCLTTGELKSLNGNFKDLISSLYMSISYKDTKFVKCSSIFLNSTSKCTKAAEIETQIEETKKMEDVERNIEENRKRHDTVLNDLIKQNVESLATSMERLQFFARKIGSSKLIREDFETNTEYCHAIQLFYDVINALNENVMSFPPCSETCSNVINDLGVFIQETQETEGLKLLELALSRPDLLNIISNIFTPSKAGSESFVDMYKFLINSHLRRCDTNVLFVLFSKFDLVVWLRLRNPKLTEISRLLQQILKGLENWNQLENTLLQDLFRRHLIHVFEHKFPEHYGEILQMILNGISDQKLMPIVLLDMLHSLLIQTDCPRMELDSNSESIAQISIRFAAQQKLLNFKEINDTIMLFTKHFQDERFHHGLHGLYPKHKNYCVPISMWLSVFGHVAVVSAIHTYSGILVDQMSSWIFGSVIGMYSPWLLTYTEDILQEGKMETSNWIRQLTENGQALYPWTPSYTCDANTILSSLVNSIDFILKTLPESHSILGHMFGWYIHHFAIPNLGKHIHDTIHSALISLPWGLFMPLSHHIELFYQRLNAYLPECHSFLRQIFMQINWKKWFQDAYGDCPTTVPQQDIYRLLHIFIKIAFMPGYDDDPRIGNILEDGIKYPWQLIEYKELENLLHWISKSIEPAVVLNLPPNNSCTNRIVLELLKASSVMEAERSSNSCDEQFKRVIYIRFIVQTMRKYSTKHPHLVGAKGGMSSYRNILFELLNTLEKIIKDTGKSREQQEIISKSLLIEIVGSTRSHSQSDVASNLLVDAIISWEHNSKVDSPIVPGIIHSIATCDTITSGMYTLLEASISNYFRYSDETKETHSPTWDFILQTLHSCLNKMDLNTLVQGQFLLILHAYIIYKYKNINTVNESIAHLQSMSALLNNITPKSTIESRIVIVWGALISFGCKLLLKCDDSKRILLSIAHYFEEISSQTDSWGEGLLGMIGLKKDTISNKQKIVSRCFSLVIYLLLSDNSAPNPECIRLLTEMKSLNQNKKCSDIRVMIQNATEMFDECSVVHVYDVPHKICEIIKLFYDDTIFRNILDVWSLGM